MSFVKIWIHAVWATKKRQAILNQDVRKEVFNHIHKNALGKGIFMEKTGGHHNHVHCLFRLKNDQTIDTGMQLIKGESSYWFNNTSDLSRQKLYWQKEYFAVSVSESQVETVKNYISNQEEHHKKKTWEEEYNEFIKHYGFKVFKG